jgi:hypothetical protein
MVICFIFHTQIKIRKIKAHSQQVDSSGYINAYTVFNKDLFFFGFYKSQSCKKVIASHPMNVFMYVWMKKHLLFLFLGFYSSISKTA